jgi:hypothetical protein
MKHDQLKRANEIIPDLLKLRDEKKRWEIAKDFGTVQLRGETGWTNAESMPNYNICKAIVIAEIDKKIKELEEEFDAL